MKTISIVSAMLLPLSAGIATADVEFSSLMQWEESQKPTVRSAIPASDDSIIAQINSMEATAAGQEPFTSLIQWEEDQYAVPFEFSIDNINNMEATAAGTSGMSSLVQWEGSAN